MSAIINISDNNECAICLENIDDNDEAIYILECCNNKVHLQCLQKWYSKGTSNSCFLCNQENKFCKELATPIDISLNQFLTPTTYITLNSNSNREFLHIKILKFLLSLIIIILIMFLLCFYL